MTVTLKDGTAPVEGDRITAHRLDLAPKADPDLPDIIGQVLKVKAHGMAVRVGCTTRFYRASDAAHFSRVP